jgi:hypothetical protein
MKQEPYSQRIMFCNFYLVKNHKIANNSTTTKAREETKADLESLEFFKLFNACLTKSRNNVILLNNISYRFIQTTELFTG